MARKNEPVSAPGGAELRTILSARSYAAWSTLTEYIEAVYPGMAALWRANNKAGLYELKYRQGGKTLCAFYVRDRHFGFMVIFGAAERARFESVRSDFSPAILDAYDAATTYHDGKWVMFEIRDAGRVEELKRILTIKRKPKER